VGAGGLPASTIKRFGGQAARRPVALNTEAIMQPHSKPCCQLYISSCKYDNQVETKKVDAFVKKTIMFSATIIIINITSLHIFLINMNLF
jgi:hypothetical protein